MARCGCNALSISSNRNTTANGFVIIIAINFLNINFPLSSLVLIGIRVSWANSSHVLNYYYLEVIECKVGMQLVRLTDLVGQVESIGVV